MKRSKTFLIVVTHATYVAELVDLYLNISRDEHIDVIHSSLRLNGDNVLYIYKENRKLIIGDYTIYLSSLPTKYMTISKVDKGYQITINN